MVHIICESGTFDKLIDTGYKLKVFTLRTCELLENICNKALQFKQENNKMLKELKMTFENFFDFLQEACPEEVYLNSEKFTALQKAYQDVVKREKEKISKVRG